MPAYYVAAALPRCGSENERKRVYRKEAAPDLLCVFSYTHSHYNWSKVLVSGPYDCLSVVFRYVFAENRVCYGRKRLD